MESLTDEVDLLNTTGIPAASRPYIVVTYEEYFTFLQVSIVIRTVLCWIGIFTNALNIRAFYRMGLEDSLTIVFFGLAITDFLHLCTAFMYAMTSLTGVLSKVFKLRVIIPPHFIWFFTAAIVRTCTEVINLTTTFLALQRCLCVALPLQFKGIFTRKRVIIVLAVIWIVVVSFFISYMLQQKIMKIHDPSINASRYVMISEPGRELMESLLYTFFGIILNTTNQLTILISVIVLARALTKSVRFRQQTSTVTGASRGDHQKSEDVQQQDKKEQGANLSNTKEKQAIIQVALVSTIYLICNIPRLSGAFATMIEPRINLYAQFHNLFTVLYISITTMDIFNSSVNFFVYYKYNSKFRSLCFRRKPTNA